MFEQVCVCIHTLYTHAHTQRAVNDYSFLDCCKTSPVQQATVAVLIDLDVI